MHKNSFLLTFLGLLVLTAAIHFTATQYLLYFHLVWLDLPVHILASTGLGILVLWALLFASWAPFKPFRSQWWFITVSVSSVLVVGTLWEVFEWYVGAMGPATNLTFDTTLDMLMNALGGTLAGWYVWQNYSRQTSSRDPLSDSNPSYESPSNTDVL